MPWFQFKTDFNLKLCLRWLPTDADAARDLRVDFLKLAPSRDFETSSRAVKNYRDPP